MAARAGSPRATALSAKTSTVMPRMTGTSATTREAIGRSSAIDAPSVASDGEANDHGPPAVSFVLQWTIATALAIPLAQLALDILFYAVLGWLLLPLAPLLGGVIGLAVGGAQSLILRQHGLAGGAWIVATGGGFAAAGLLAFVALAIAAAAHPLARLALLAAISSVIGLAQLQGMVVGTVEHGGMDGVRRRADAEARGAVDRHRRRAPPGRSSGRILDLGQRARRDPRRWPARGRDHRRGAPGARPAPRARSA